MSFWSGETLLKNLPWLIRPFDPANIDCGAYTLSIGRELYISPTDETPNPKSTTKRQLGVGEPFAIPPGQFAFLLTDEMISLPHDCIAFISIKAKVKFRGLVNVSGFHVDPGFRGQLVYSVFNAGPVPVHLQQGQPCFLIWFTSLDNRSDTYVKKGSSQNGIDPSLINGISGEIQSLEGLAKKVATVEHQQNIVNVITGFVIVTILPLIIGFYISLFPTTRDSSRPSVSSTASASPSPEAHASKSLSESIPRVHSSP